MMIDRPQWAGYIESRTAHLLIRDVRNLCRGPLAAPLDGGHGAAHRACLPDTLASSRKQLALWVGSSLPERQPG